MFNCLRRFPTWKLVCFQLACTTHCDIPAGLLGCSLRGCHARGIEKNSIIYFQVVRGGKCNSATIVLNPFRLTFCTIPQFDRSKEAERCNHLTSRVIISTRKISYNCSYSVSTILDCLCCCCSCCSGTHSQSFSFPSILHGLL